MPYFQQLSLAEKQKVLVSVYPEFKTFTPQTQMEILDTVHYTPKLGPQPRTSDFKTAAREITLGGMSGFTGLPETQHPAQDLLKSMTTPRKMGVSDVLSAGIPAIPVAKNLYSAGKELFAGPQGDTGTAAHGLGSLVGQILQLKTAMKVPEAAGAEATTPKLLRPLETIQGGPVKAGVEDIFRAAEPGAGKDINLRENVEVAKNDLAQIQRDTPLEGKGGIIRPDLRLRNFASNVTDYLDRTWKQQVNPQVGRWKDAVVNVRPIKQAMLDTITKTDRESSPAGVRAVERWVERMPDEDTLGGLADRRVTVNAYLRGFEGKSAGEQSQVMRTKPLVDALKAQDKAIVKKMFGELKSRGEPGMDELERRYAALSNIRDAASSQMNSAETFRLLDRLRFYFSPSRLFSAREYLKASPTSGRLMERGLNRFKRGGLEAPPITGPGERILPPANRQLPSARVRLGPVPDTSGTVEGARTQPVSPDTRAARLGLLLPERSGAPIRLGTEGTPEQPPYFRAKRGGTLAENPIARPAQAIAAVDPRTGKSIPQYLTSARATIGHTAEGGDILETPTEGQQARIVGKGSKRRLEVWSAEKKRWVPLNVNFSGEK